VGLWAHSCLYPNLTLLKPLYILSAKNGGLTWTHTWMKNVVAPPYLRHLFSSFVYLVSNERIPEGLFSLNEIWNKALGKSLILGYRIVLSYQPHMSSLHILSVIVCMIVLFPASLVHVYNASCIHNTILMILATILGAL
jgi:hypothetical protein